MTVGDDILYLIALRNLEIHLVIGLCCFEECYGMGLKLACNGTHHMNYTISSLIYISVVVSKWSYERSNSNKK